MTTLDIAHLKSWVGRTEVASDTITPWLVSAFRATLDEPSGAIGAGDPAPQGIHWCLALPTVPMALIGEDGHPARGGFLPPVPLPRRMWAGGRLSFHEPLQIGDLVTRTSTVKSVEMKEGRTGALVFVLVEHRVECPRGLAIIEEHDIVYRGLDAPAVRPDGQVKVQEQADIRQSIDASPVLLFRYSALTFNGHRIHYDRPYVTQVEGYPGLIVHGPLQATLLIKLGNKLKGTPLSKFSFRAQKPLFDLAPFTIAGRGKGEGRELWVEDASGDRTMSADAS
jgi:3-methylfumaryl-CoA hydratase